MNANRMSTVAFVIVVAAVALATASFAAPKSQQLSDDFALRHLSGMPQPAADLTAYYLGSDFALRHTAIGIDTSDYALRHPAAVVVQAVDTSDYGLRHPEWMAAPVVDTSDYALRHLTNGTDTSDYFLRHPELLGQ